MAQIYMPISKIEQLYGNEIATKIYFLARNTRDIWYIPSEKCNECGHCKTEPAVTTEVFKLAFELAKDISLDTASKSYLY